MMSLSRSTNDASTGRVSRLCCGLALSFAVGAVACSEEESEPMAPLRGSAGSGGTGAGAAGSAGSAGTSGSGGASGGSAGTSGAGGGGSSTPTTVYDFSDSLEGFAINYYCLGPANGQNCSAVAAAPAPEVDAGVDAGDAGAAPPSANGFYSVTHDPAVGDPAGSAKIEVNFTAGEQTAVFALNYAVGANLTGKTITARVLVDAGAPATTSAKLYIKTGANFYYADRGAITLIAGTWLTLTYETGLAPVYPSAPTAEYVLADVREIGIELAATGIATPALTVVHIDSVQY